MIKFVSDLQQFGGFLHAGTPVSTNKTDFPDITEILLKVALNTIKQTNQVNKKKTNEIINLDLGFFTLE